MRPALVVFTIAVALRLLFYAVAPELREPSYPDASYYSAVASSLIEGRGLTVPYIWAFVDVGGAIPANPTLPVPAFAHWAPLAVLVQLPFVALLGAGGIGSYLPFWIAAGCFAVLSMRVATRAGLASRATLAVGLIVAGGSGAGALIGQIDNYALFGSVLLCWVLAMDNLRRTPSGRSAALAGVVAGVAMLCRTDGLLLIGAGGLVLLMSARHRGGLSRIAVYLSGALAVLLPFWIRQLETFGSISPSAESGRILYIRTYDELFSAGGPLTIDHLLSWGAGPLLASRLEAVGVVASQLGLVVAGAVTVPFALVGLRRAFAQATLRPYLLWLALHTLWSIVVAAPHLPTGNYLHSAVAALGLIAICAVMGIERIAPRLASISSFGTAPNAQRSVRRWTFGVVAASWTVAVVTTTGIVSAWAPRNEARAEIADYLRAVAAPDHRLMSADPGSWWWRSGITGVATPYDPYPMTEAALVAYGIDWLVIDREEAVPAIQPLLAGASLPGLTGPCAVVRNGPRIESALYRVGAPCPPPIR